MGLDDHMLACIKALAENRIQDAKNEAICCCVNDTTKKNQSKTEYYKKLLMNGSVNGADCKRCPSTHENVGIRHSICEQHFDIWNTGNWENGICQVYCL